MVLEDLIKDCNVAEDSKTLLNLIFELKYLLEAHLKEDLYIDLIQEIKYKGGFLKRLLGGRSSRFRKKYHYRVFYKNRKLFRKSTLFTVEFPNSLRSMNFSDGKIIFKTSNKYVDVLNSFIVKSNAAKHMVVFVVTSF